MCVCVCVHVHACLHVCVCMCVCVCICVCMWGVHVPVQIPEYNSKSEYVSFVSCLDATIDDRHVASYVVAHIQLHKCRAYLQQSCVICTSLYRMIFRGEGWWSGSVE